MRKLLELCGADEEIKFSPYVWRVRLILMYKGLDFESVSWRFTEGEALEPTGGRTVPALFDDGKWVSDSFEIAKYLDKKYPEKPVLGDDSAMAGAIFFNKWVNRVVVMDLFPMIAADVWDNLTPEGQDYFRPARERFIGSSLEAARDNRPALYSKMMKELAPMRDVIRDQDYLAGDDGPLFADFAAFGTLLWAHFISDLTLFTPTDPLGRWFERMMDYFGDEIRSLPTAYKG